MITALQGNDFQPVVTSRIPVLTTALDAMHADGAIVALLAGSGGCVFGIFGEAADRDRARTVVEGQGVACWSCETLRSMPVPQVDPPRNAG